MNRFMFIIVSALLCFSVKGQVTIGSGNTPAEYSILQIDGTEGGLRLPRIESEADRDALPTQNDVGAAGLVIYYKPDNAIQFWNGNRWVNMLSLKTLNESKNGIRGSNHFALGNNITESTEITQNTQSLYFDASSGRFLVGDNFFVVDKEGVEVGGNPLGGVPLDLSSATLGGLKIKKAGENLSPGLVMGSDEYGNAVWKDLKPNPEATEIALPAVNINSSTPVNLKTVSLTKGTWLIMARYVVKSGTLRTASNFGNHAFIRFRKTSSADDLAAIGTLPERNNENSSGSRFNVKAAPQLTYIVEVKEDIEDYNLMANLYIPNNSGVAINVIPTDADMGKSYITTIQLSKK